MKYGSEENYIVPRNKATSPSLYALGSQFRRNILEESTIETSKEKTIGKNIFLRTNPYLYARRNQIPEVKIHFIKFKVSMKETNKIFLYNFRTICRFINVELIYRFEQSACKLH